MPLDATWLAVRLADGGLAAVLPAIAPAVVRMATTAWKRAAPADQRAK